MGSEVTGEVTESRHVENFQIRALLSRRLPNWIEYTIY